MTSQQLHDMTKSLFEKHPSAKTDLMPGNLIPDVDAPQEYVDAAALIITGHLTQWLAEKCAKIDGEELPILAPCFGDKEWNIGFHHAPTLLEALIAAAMTVPTTNKEEVK